MTDHRNSNLKEQNSAQSREKLFNVPPVIVVIIAVLVLIQLVQQIAGESFQNTMQALFAFIPSRFGPNPTNQEPGSAYWSFVTYAALHADWLHVGFNSLWLLIFSKPVVFRLGTWRYLILLTVSIIAGAVAGLIVHWGQFLVMVGISAGVSGVMAAAIPIMNAHGFHGTMTALEVKKLNVLLPVQILQNRQALAFTLLWLALTLFTATSQYVTGTAFLEERVIAWEAHLGGFIAGFLAFYLLDRKAKAA